MVESEVTSLMVKKELAEKMRNYCKVNGLKIQFVTNKIIKEYLDRVDKDV